MSSMARAGSRSQPWVASIVFGLLAAMVAASCRAPRGCHAWLRWTSGTVGWTCPYLSIDSPRTGTLSEGYWASRMVFDGASFFETAGADVATDGPLTRTAVAGGAPDHDRLGQDFLSIALVPFLAHSR